MSLYSSGGYVDLSKRRVDPEDVGRCEDRYNKAKAVHGVLRHVAEMKGLRLDYLYQTVGWPLYRKYGHAYHAFKSAISGYVDTSYTVLNRPLTLILISCS